MRRLVLVRHAKAAGAVPGRVDHDRPLVDAGRAEAPAVAERVAALGFAPDRVVCSDAARAVETWARMATRLREVPVTFDRRLYQAGAGTLDEVVREVPDDPRCLWAIGHNPGWEEVVRELAGESVTLGTCTAALLTCRVDAPWSAGLAPRAFTLAHVVRP